VETSCALAEGIQLKAKARHLSAQYTNQAMGWATVESGLDSQWRQIFLSAGVSDLALAPTEPVSTGGICPRRNRACWETDNHLVPVLSVSGTVPPPPLVMTGRLRHHLTLPTQLPVVG